ncbi:DUF1801 domain-containing protein [Reinekea forsetii]|nr:DUF1801 domain-containing protein [Reinekea forsetii]
MNPDTKAYNDSQEEINKDICVLLANEINKGLPEAENKIWHAHPVWFLDGNPIVGYGNLKHCIRLMFWSGQSFKGDSLTKTGSFQAGEVRYTSLNQINTKLLQNWLSQSRDIQWDYKNIVKRKGKLERLK